MPRYYFNICNEQIVRDEEGTLCDNFEAALQEAEASARDLAKQYIDNHVPVSHCFIQVLDENGNHLFTLGIKDVIERSRNHASKPRKETLRSF